MAGESTWCSSRYDVAVEICGESARVKVFQAFTLRKVIEFAAEGVRYAVSNDFNTLVTLVELSTNWNGGAAAEIDETLRWILLRKAADLLVQSTGHLKGLILPK